MRLLETWVAGPSSSSPWSWICPGAIWIGTGGNGELKSDRGQREGTPWGIQQELPTGQGDTVKVNGQGHPCPCSPKRETCR